MQIIEKKLGSKGEVVLPKSVRQVSNIKPGEKVVIEVLENGQIIIMPKKKNLSKLIGSFEPKHKVNWKRVEELGEFYRFD